MGIHLEVKGRLFVTASSQTGRSQQTVDPVGNPSTEDQMPLNNATLSVVDENFSLFNENSRSLM